MDIREVKSFLGDDWTATQDCILRALDSDIALLNSTNESILQHSGKQLRPMISLLVARACAGGEIRPDSYRYAAAAELLHNATLLHDDVADESDTRRGCPTVNALMGPSVSVLVGDYWLAKAVECILDAEGFSADITKVFSATLRHLAEGEMFQLQKAQGGDTTEDDYLRIIYDKTATLFEAAARSAAMGVNAPEQTVEAMAKYSRNLGLAFQIRDDIFDYSEGFNIGKPVGADILERKITLPLLEAFRAAGKEAEKDIRAKMTAIREHPEYKAEIVDFVRRWKGAALAQRRLEAFASEAVAQLACLPESREKEYLAAIARYVGLRQN